MLSAILACPTRPCLSNMTSVHIPQIGSLPVSRLFAIQILVIQILVIVVGTGLPRPVWAEPATDSLTHSATAQDPPRPPAWGQAELAGLITDSKLSEISGLVASRRHADTLWVHNDSGDGPVLHAMSYQGERRATLTLENTGSRDWEDMAGFRLDGREYLLIADTGDNGGLRSTLSLHIIAEPDQIADARTTPAWSIHFRWPDGPRDCEAVAVDVQAGIVLLIGKKRSPPDLFSLPLRPNDDHIQTAEPIGLLAGIVQPTAEDLRRNPRFGRYRSQITGADLDDSGLLLAVLNYRRAHVYPRRPGESWGTAVARAPIEIPFPWLPQAEAIGFDAQGTLWIASEQRPAPLLRLPRRH